MEEAAQKLDQEADSRIAEVLKSTEKAKETSDRNVLLLQENKKLLTAQLTTQSLAAANAKSDMNAQALRHEEEIKTLNNRMRGLQVQISARQRSQGLRQRRRARGGCKAACGREEGWLKTIDDKVTEIKKMEAGIAAVNTSCKEANKAKVAAERNAKMFSKQLETESGVGRLCWQYCTWHPSGL